MKYKIFGKIVNITSEHKEIIHLIEKELQIYPISKKSVDIEINFVNKIILTDEYSNSPSIHSTIKEGFLASYGKNKILYCKSDIIKIQVELYIHHNKFKNNIAKFKNIGFKNNIENIGAIIHELILVPFNYFFTDRALIHSSSMKNLNNGKTILFGGTGGVGKTTLELYLCKELGYSFLSDDMAIIDEHGNIYPNLSHPKIYAYNVEGNPQLKNLLFNERSVYDKFHWIMLKKLKGLSGVRRTISPDKIYQSVEKDKNKISEYYILSRSNKDSQIVMEKINSNDAAILTLKVIINEYHAFEQHIIWHEYNSILLKTLPILTLENIHKNWLNIYKHIFKNIKCFHITIPTNINHEDFLSFVKENF